MKVNQIIFAICLAYVHALLIYAESSADKQMLGVHEIMSRHVTAKRIYKQQEKI